MSAGRQRIEEEIPPDLAEDLLDISVDRYLNGNALIGNPDAALPLIRDLQNAGVDEIACLVDFGLPEADVMQSMGYLAELAEQEEADPQG